MRFVRLDEKRGSVATTMILPFMRCERSVQLSGGAILKVYEVSEHYKVVVIERPHLEWWQCWRFHVIGSPDFASFVIDKLMRRDYDSLSDHAIVIKGIGDDLIAEKNMKIKGFLARELGYEAIETMRGLWSWIAFEDLESAKRFYEEIARSVSERINEDTVRRWILDLVDRFPNAVVKLEARPRVEVLKGVYLTLYTDLKLSKRLTRKLLEGMEVPAILEIKELMGERLSEMMGRSILTFAVEKNGELYAFKDPRIAIGLVSLLREPLDLDEKICEVCEHLHPLFVYKAIPSPTNKLMYQRRFRDIARRVYESGQVDTETIKALKRTVYPAIGIWDLAGDGWIVEDFDLVVEGLLYLYAFLSRKPDTPFVGEILSLAECVRYFLLKYCDEELDWCKKLWDPEYLENEVRRLANREPLKLRRFTKKDLFDFGEEDIDGDSAPLREMSFPF